MMGCLLASDDETTSVPRGRAVDYARTIARLRDRMEEAMTHPLPFLLPRGLGNISVVDMGDWTSGDEATRARFIGVVGDALREYGFLRLRGHLCGARAD